MLEKFIRKYYDEIFRYCYHHVESRATAEDLCQDTFVSFIVHYQEYRHMGKMKNYLYTIAGNKCRDYYRKKMPLFMAEVPKQEAGQEKAMTKFRPLWRKQPSGQVSQISKSKAVHTKYSG